MDGRVEVILPKSLKDNFHLLCVLCDKNLSVKLRKAVLKESSLSLVAAICNCGYNILKKQFPITPDQVKQLKKHREFLYSLVEDEGGLQAKRTIILSNHHRVGDIIRPVVEILQPCKS